LALLNSKQARKISLDAHVVNRVRYYLLVKAGPLDEAERCLESMFEGPEPPPRSEHEQLLGYLALARNDPKRARYHAQRSIAFKGTDCRVTYVDSIRVLIMAELLSRNAAGARALLETMDKNGSDPLYTRIWFRLHLLEGNEAQAAEAFNRIYQNGRNPEYLREVLRFAHEVSPLQVASMLVYAKQGFKNPPSNRTALSPREAQEEVESSTTKLVGASPQLKAIRKQIRKYAALDSTVLITGETGTGKEIVARLLHEHSTRKKEPFVAINCAAVSESLMEAELFGHVKGAFTGATRAHDGLLVAGGGGTVLLDEVNAMPARLQAALLRALEEREVRPVGASRKRPIRARILAASNEPLEDLMDQRRMRADLYFRLAHLTIKVPPLRERSGDLSQLAHHFLRTFGGGRKLALSADLLKAFERYAWPGNVRELRNEMERMVILAGDHQTLDAKWFNLNRQASSEPYDSTLSDGAQRGTQERRRRLSDLFGEHVKLSRKEAARLLRCAPNTVAGDLGVLEEQGLIRRVRSPSGRTVYFMLCEQVAV
jgi:DNA-binding NtrC family response regulator